MKKLLNWFYLTSLGQLWLEFLLRRKQNQVFKAFDSAWDFNKNQVEIVHDSVQQKYQEGLNTLKKKVNSQPDLVTTTELINLAHEETDDQRKLREVREQIYVNRIQDIKNEVDKHQMINRRIDDFYTLQTYNEERNLIKQIKEAKKLGKKDLAERLEHDWQQRFRPSVH